MPQDVKIASFGTIHDAELARLYLDENGFDVRLEDEILMGAALPFETALGGVKMFVPFDQAEEAIHLIEEFRTQPREKREPDSSAMATTRAFRIAIIGFILCPGVMHLWSLAMVLNVPATDLSGASLRTRRATIGLSVLGIAIMLVATLIALTTPREPPPGPPPQPVFFPL